MEQMPGYLAVRFIGVGEPGEASAQFEPIAEHCRRMNNDRLLIDTTGYEAKVYVADRFQMGERAQIFACCRIKVAFVCRPEQVDSKKFGRLVARNRGVSIDVFTDFQAAEEWLLK
jgi:dihydroxyacetone kinase